MTHYAFSLGAHGSHAVVIHYEPDHPGDHLKNPPPDRQSNRSR